MNKKKRIIAALLCVALTLSMGAMATYNLDNVEVVTTATSDVMSSIANTFDLNSNTGYAYYNAATTGTMAATKSSVTVVIQRKEGSNWVNVTGTSKTTNSSDRYAYAWGEYYLLKGYWYRVKSYHVVYQGTTPYSDTMYSQLEWYN